ncbi:oligosaccharide flippase family protein, partial [Candidatus Symbiothrix dinenymphae]|uniref:oligosaccharide flippase family protein n=1 Tax=Candidatus Symbiothrix dinenymphae TaxID=467085 RepID=UPI000AF67272
MIKQHITDFFSTGHERSIKAKKSIVFLVLIKMASILIGLLLFRVAIDYLDADRYGIWLTVSSIVFWLEFFDIGLSNGMRNKFVEAVARGDDKTAKAYVSTTYLSLGIIIFFVWLVFAFVNKYIDWCALLKIPENNSSEIPTLVFIVFSYFCIQFVLRIVNTVLLANQQSEKSSFIGLLGQLFSLTVIVVLMYTTRGSLIYLGLGLTAAPLLVLLIANIYVFRGENRKYAPSFGCCRFKYFKDIFGLSFKFFIIQVAGLIQYQTANIIIARQFNMESVTEYNTAF